MSDDECGLFGGGDEREDPPITEKDKQKRLR